MTMQQDAETAQYALPSVLDLAAADSLLATMRKLVAAGRPVALDASAVDTLTLPCIQIIVSAQRGEVPVLVVNASDAFAAAFVDLGLEFVAGEPGMPIALAEAPAIAPATEADPPPPAVAEAPAATEEAAADQPDAASVAAKRILTIDDSKTIRDMLKFTLLDAGFDVAQAVDGQDGCDILAREQFDVVITDINMPKLDGYGVIRHMRSKPEFDKTPILVLTTESDGDKRNIARDAGATGWLVKPFDPAALIATINKVSP